MANKIQFVKIVLIALVMFVMVTSANAIGIGISPGSINVNNILRGGYAEFYVYVSNPNPVPINVSLGIDGPASGWIKQIEPDGNLVIEPKEIGIFKLSVTPPSTTPNGIYNATLTAVANPVSSVESGAGAAISAGAAAILYIGVSDEAINSYKTISISIEPVEECRPIVVNFHFVNDGNVKIRPIANISIINYEKNFTVKSFMQTFDEMLPTTELKKRLEIPFEYGQFGCIPEGNYSLNVKMYIQGRVSEEKTILFKILERGAISITGNLTEVIVPESAFVGDTIKIIGIFNNTGLVSEHVKLKSEISKEGKIVTVAESDELLVPVNSTINLTTYFTPKDAGNYTIHSFVIFEGKISNSIDSLILVKINWTPLVVILVIAIIVAIIIVYFVEKRKRNR